MVTFLSLKKRDADHTFLELSPWGGILLKDLYGVKLKAEVLEDFDQAAHVTAAPITLSWYH